MAEIPASSAAGLLPVRDALPALHAALAAHAGAVLVAPPGAGKTTLVPLALLEASWRGDGRIMVLEPRRLAARAAARRMAALLGEKAGERVGYRVRMETRIGPKTRIEVVTPGVLSRMLLDDPALEGVAAILFDECHERGLESDLALALALDARTGLREDLRLLAMSATLEGARFAGLLGVDAAHPAPVIESKGRMFPVETRYLGRDPGQRLPDAVVSAVRRALRDSTGSLLVFLPGQGEIRLVARLLEEVVDETVMVHPLYGSLDARAQDAAISPAPSGTRKVVLATSIAETSLTIDGVTVVVDAGLARVPRYDPSSGMTRLETVRVSQAAADQRRGRAGRTAPGLCYRLWDEGQTRALAPFDRPEMLEADLCALVLDLADWGVHDPRDLRWLDGPPAPAWQEAVSLLQALDALDAAGAITPAGRALRHLPLHPRLAHMIAAAPEPQRALACRIAALIEEPGYEREETDLRHRVEKLERDRSPRGRDLKALAQRWQNSAGALPRSGRTLPEALSPQDACGMLLALAYPERIAKARGGGGRFLLANGRGGKLEEADALAREAFLVVADMQGGAADGRIRLAAPVSRAALDAVAGPRIEIADSLAFDREARSVKAETVTRLGAMTLGRVPQTRPDPEQVTAVLLEGLRHLGLEALPWSDRARRLRQRLAYLHQADPEGWPDGSDKALLATLETWLGPFCLGISSVKAITPPLLSEALLGTLDYPSRAALDQWAPERWTAPSGGTHAIDYSAEGGPKVSLRVQEVYGLSQHPTIADGRVPLTLELLSPAHRPIQITRDLPGFWTGSWADVRSDMRGRYPKHLWPEDPATTPAFSGVRPRR